METKEIKYDEKKIENYLQRRIQNALEKVLGEKTSWDYYGSNLAFHNGVYKLCTEDKFKWKFFMWIIPYKKQVGYKELLLTLKVTIPFNEFGDPQPKHKVKKRDFYGFVDLVDEESVIVCDVCSSMILNKTKEVLDEFQKQHPEFPIRFYNHTHEKIS
jgi:hypothetical protein